MSTLTTQLEIEIIGVIADSHKPDGEPIDAPNFGAARRQVLTRLGYVCDKRSKAARVMSSMSTTGLLVRQDDNPTVWGFRSDHTARARCRELMKQIDSSSDKTAAATLRGILSGLTVPTAVTTA